MKWTWVLSLLLFAGCGTANNAPAAATQPSNQNADLEKVLEDVNQQWLCAGPYQKSYKDCVEFRSKYWVDQFFEVVSTGDLLHKDEMVSTQTAAIQSRARHWSISRRFQVEGGLWRLRDGDGSHEFQDCR